MATNYAQYVQDGEGIDYTPAADTPAGTVVVQGNLIGVTKKPIDANTLGTIAVEGVFDFPKSTAAGSGIVAGSTVYWDAVNNVATATAGANTMIGKTIMAAADADVTVRVRLHQ